MSGGTRLRAALDTTSRLLVPGVGSPLEARLVERADFDAVYLSGYATAAIVHGVPDIGLLGRAEIVDNLRRVTAATELPVIVDGDTGYGDVAAVAATMRDMEAAGAAAVQIEDQVWPKRCGHLNGKEVIAADAMVRKVAAAVAARRSSTLLIVRTDALAPLGLQEAIARGKRYIDAGADVIFVDAPSSVGDLETIARELTGVPLVVNVSEGGRTPTLAAAEFERIGFQIVLYPSTAVRVAAASLGTFFAELKEHEDSRRVSTPYLPLEELNEVVGMRGVEDFESSIIATTYSLPEGD